MVFIKLNKFMPSHTYYVCIQVDDTDPKKISDVQLDSRDKLSALRKLLEHDAKIKMSNCMLFTKGAKVIDIREEDLMGFIEIMDCKHNTIHIRDFDEKFKLGFGRTVTYNGIEIATARAFNITDCKFESIEPCFIDKDGFPISSIVDVFRVNNLMIKTKKNLDKAKCDMRTPKTHRSRIEIHDSINYEKHIRATWKLEPQGILFTDEFEGEVKEAIESKDVKNLINVTKKFGQFIPCSIEFGGRLCIVEKSR
ncbi:1051_t:CDS:1, partial [Acaulospora colombiana]